MSEKLNTTHNHCKQDPLSNIVSLTRSKSSSVSSEPEAVRSHSSSRHFCFLRTFQCRHSASESNQSEIWSCAHMLGTGYMEVVTRRQSPCSSSCRLRPSKETHEVLRLSGEMEICMRRSGEGWRGVKSVKVTLHKLSLNSVHTFNSTPAGTTMGRKLSECGQMGVTIIAGTEGCIIEAPAATAYAVLPVGVDTIKPSPCTDVIYLPSKKRSILLRYGEGPRSITTSFSTYKTAHINTHSSSQFQTCHPPKYSLSHGCYSYLCHRSHPFDNCMNFLLFDYRSRIPCVDRSSCRWHNASDCATWGQHDLPAHLSLALGNFQIQMALENQANPNGMPSPVAPIVGRAAKHTAVCHRHPGRQWNQYDRLDHHAHLCFAWQKSAWLIKSSCWKLTICWTYLNVTNFSLIFLNFLSSISSGSSSTADSTQTTMCFSCTSHSTSCTKGASTVESRTFFMTSTVSGGLYQVRRWLAGSWICLQQSRRKQKSRCE